MTEPCLPFEELLALAHRETGDARREHVRTCPRCRSRLAAYGLFTALGRDAPHPGEEQAVARIQATLRAHIRPVEPLPVEPLPVERAGTPWWAPRWLVPAVGAAAILAGAFLLARDDLPRPAGVPVVRDAPASSREPAVSTAPIRPLPDGSMELRWSAVASADSYRVRILDPGLYEIARLAAGAETSLVLAAADLRTWSTQAAYWQVQALSEGDRLADSAPEALPR